MLRDLQQAQGASFRINLNASSVAKPPAGTGAIRERSMRADGFPSARANVTALVVRRPGDAPNVAGPLNAVTDEDGRYEFADVMRGHYSIRATTPGFKDAYD